VSARGSVRLREPNPDRYIGVEPRRRFDASTWSSFRQLLQPTWCQTYCSAFLWTTSARSRGGWGFPAAWVTLDFHRTAQAYCANGEVTMFLYKSAIYRLIRRTEADYDGDDGDDSTTNRKLFISSYACASCKQPVELNTCRHGDITYVGQYKGRKLVCSLLSTVYIIKLYIYRNYT